MKTDPRYIALRKGLEQLMDFELGKIIAWNQPMCCDTFNYDESTKRY